MHKATKFFAVFGTLSSHTCFVFIFNFYFPVCFFRLCLVLRPRPLLPTQAAPWLPTFFLLAFFVKILFLFLVCQGFLCWRSFCFLSFCLLFVLHFVLLRVWGLATHEQHMSNTCLSLSFVKGLWFLCSRSRPPSFPLTYFFVFFSLQVFRGCCAGRKSTKLNQTKPN